MPHVPGQSSIRRFPTREQDHSTITIANNVKETRALDEGFEHLTVELGDSGEIFLKREEHQRDSLCN